MHGKELINRKCNSCTTKIEDEFHVIIECPRYEKNTFHPEYLLKRPNIFIFNTISK